MTALLTSQAQNSPVPYQVSLGPVHPAALPHPQSSRRSLTGVLSKHMFGRVMEPKPTILMKLFIKMSFLKFLNYST